MSLAIHPSSTHSVDALGHDRRLARLAPRPQTLADTGLSQRFLADLIAKHLNAAGTLTLAQLTERLALSGPIVEQVLNFMRKEARIEIKPRLEATGALPYALTDRGRSTALDAFMRSGYVGPAPMPLENYVGVVQAQCVHSRQVGPDAVKAAFEGMIIAEEAAEQFGISINSGRAIFIYGPPGSGKTYVSHRLARLFRELVLIPHSIMIDETVVQVFDPLLHRAMKAFGDEQPLMLERGHDPRYVICERPVIITGGELTMDLLDVRYEPSTRTYEAPLQLKANNGLFVIDDLGRQKVSPDALLNRWIVPMQERRDYHSLGSGRHFVVPFDVVLIFSSNMHPLDLADEAFLRRIGHKIYCGYISEEDYKRIWRDVCEEHHVPFDPAVVEFVLEDLHAHENVPLLPCHPRDLVGIALDKLAFTGAPQQLTEDLLRWAWRTYFISNREAGWSRNQHRSGAEHG